MGARSIRPLSLNSLALTCPCSTSVRSFNSHACMSSNSSASLHSFAFISQSTKRQNLRTARQYTAMATAQISSSPRTASSVTPRTYSSGGLSKLSSGSKSARRFASDYAAVVAGSGPAGLAVVGNLIDSKVKGKILWVDPDLAAGNLHRSWREVPSNTKVRLFMQYAEALDSFKQVIKDTSRPNAISTLEEMNQDEGCQISLAADMCLMLSKGILQSEHVDGFEGKVTGANWNGVASRWTVEVKPSESAASETISSSRLILCTGAVPTALPIPVSDLKMQRINLDTALTPSVLKTTLPNDSPLTVAVIGASHSAILILMNLYNLSRSSHPQLRVQWFTRSGLLYAIQKDGWILYDNTGLKGQAATFAKENLEDDKLAASPVGKIIRKIDCSKGQERKMYHEHLPSCTHIIHATGFAPNPVPTLTADGNPIGEVDYDHRQGTFSGRKDGEGVPGLFGAGIAYPERTKDPEGNVELAVGLFKFMRYLKRVVPEWVASSKPAL